MSLVFLNIVFGLLLFAALAVMAWIDFRTYRLPNILTFPLMATGLVSAYFLPLISLQSSLIGLAIGYTGFVVLEKLFKSLYGKDGLGRGDAKLLAAGGAWCGWFGLPYIILIASLCGLVFTQLPSQKKRLAQGTTYIAFGPFLCLGIIVVWLAQLYFG